MASNLVPIDIIARNIASGMGDSTGKFIFPITRHLLSGYREMNLFVGKDFNVKTAILEHDNVVCLPKDFVYETKVGVLYKGHLAVLSLSKDVKRRKISQSEAEKELNDIWEGEYGLNLGYTFYNCFRGGNSLGEMYGYGRGVTANGFYSIDKKNGEIYIGSLIPKEAEIVVEYKSDGISDGLKLVPTEMEMCLSYYAKARFYEERRDFQAASWNEERFRQQRYKIKTLYNFKNALYFATDINEMFSQTNY